MSILGASTLMSDGPKKQILVRKVRSYEYWLMRRGAFTSIITHLAISAESRMGWVSGFENGQIIVFFSSNRDLLICRWHLKPIC
jgi:hypothetical protein